MNDLQPHDQFFKQIFSEPKRVKSLLDIFYPELSQKIDLESIRLLNILDYISVVNNPQEVENVLKEILGGEKEMMTLTEKWKMEGLQQGLIKAKQEDIIKLINLKFGRVSEEVGKFVLEISDLEELDKLFTKAVLANSLEELLKRD